MNGDGSLLCMRSGTIVDLAHPDPAVVCIEDIAAHLSAINRWVGCLRVPVSVAAHSVVVSKLITEYGNSWSAAALLHDAAEAYLGDVSWPLKQMIGAPYADLEDEWALAIGKRLGYHWADGFAMLKEADTETLVAEARLFGPPQALEVVRRNLKRELPNTTRAEKLYTRALLKDSEAAFLRRWHELTRRDS